MRIPRFLALLSLATLVLCAASFADSSFDFSTNNPQDINAPTVTLNAIGGTITLWGFSKDHMGMTTFPTNLWFKNDSAPENGIGLADNPSGRNEIVGTNFVQFTDKGLTGVSIGSVQTGEGWALYESTTLGTLGTLIASGVGDANSEASQSFAGIVGPGFGFVSLKGTGTNTDGTIGDVLLADATFAPAVPEPSTPAFILTLGLVGLFEISRRKLMA